MSAVERAVLERQLVGAPLDEPDTVARARASSTRRRPAASISALWSSPTTRQPRLPDELDRDSRRARRDVEHLVAGAAPRSARRGSAASAGPARARADGSSGRSVGPSGAKSSCATCLRSEKRHAASLCWPRGAPGRSRPCRGRRCAFCRRRRGARPASSRPSRARASATYLCAFAAGEERALARPRRRGRAGDEARR